MKLKTWTVLMTPITLKTIFDVHNCRPTHSDDSLSTLAADGDNNDKEDDDNYVANHEILMMMLLDDCGGDDYENYKYQDKRPMITMIMSRMVLLLMVMMPMMMIKMTVVIMINRLCKVTVVCCVIQMT